MPWFCAAFGCSNRLGRGSEIRFYRFPLVIPELTNQWVQSMGPLSRSGLGLVPTNDTCLCSEHFRSDCFRDYKGKLFLKQDAVPTIFTWNEPVPRKPGQ